MSSVWNILAENIALDRSIARLDTLCESQIYDVFLSERNLTEITVAISKFL